MVYSMTGFGSSKFEDENYKINIEVKSLNSKYLDLQLRLPRNLSDKEMDLRALVSKLLNRGKVVVNIECESKGEETDLNYFNHSKFKSVYKELQRMAEEMGYTGNDIFKLTLDQPEISNTNQLTETPEELFKHIKNTLKEALESCMEHRKNEGKDLAIELNNYISSIEKLREEVVIQEKERGSRIRERLEESISKNVKAEEVDKNRLEQEIIYYLEKLDITEELVRLESHINYFKEVLQENNCGKKLGFLSQELGREINTIGSKANDANIQKTVVLMKEELEKIKEQSLNVV